MKNNTKTEELDIKQWADDLGITNGLQQLAISLKERPHKMAHSNATGEGLVTNGFLGVDIIRLKAGDKFVPHTHPGDHLLIVVGGQGTITYNGNIYPTKAGQVYMVEGRIPHGVGAITDHVILAVGAPHKAVDDPERMKVVDYKEIISKIGDMHCLICKKDATYPEMLHKKGCKHCPCDKC
ncbi:hypothetical protein A3F03_03995 [Candidatus Roizmanbacteria bacterium RIFCSPHIGHO2_12_FULL_41_11]|uniref:Cupin type-2 domain-containing protein n=2 Tax=Candidatus Roizmaniibacteriota TaxID=1752723 RepID=A0A1F7J8R4_9BACT|nr:MAG: hypothetical protein A3F03_03995 [Candidatus Roizmanbacteria bacterium RIFCSPHIGHO2_12_FULL_41_11]OGK51966.1 MAG: hypothetical protein A2966_04135 [Candidatus Roizmanbacteria bacterium RIFCSPLOWO2_01_FULL_41_22]